MGRETNGGARPGAGRKSKAKKAGLEDILNQCVTLADRAKIFGVLKKKALAGEDFSMQLLLAYLYGKPIQRQEITGADGGPIRTRAEDLTDDQLAAIAASSSS